MNNLVKKPIKGGTPAIENKVAVKRKLTEGRDFKDDKTNKETLFE
tara:strand:- start:195 stop:329 length:135 start_codon:yes stop_codon:yes gene_type:complete